MNDAVKTQKTLYELNSIADKVVDSLFSVHRTMGPGLNESIYHACLAKEFEIRGIIYASQVMVPVAYKGHDLDKHFYLDLLVEEEIIVELKAVADLLPVHHAQILNYMKLTNKRIGYLVNFNVELLKNGISRKRLDSGTNFRPSTS